MWNLLLVGFGGAIGAMARYLVGGWVLHHAIQERLPWGTLAVNLLGCLAIGLLAGAAERFEILTPEARLFLVTGVLGGFTTFSAFGYDTVFLLRRGEALVAAGYVGASVGLGIAAVWLGLRMVHWLPR
jgi:CrcB protein